MLPSATFNHLWSMPGCCPAICPCNLGCSDEERYQANSAPSPIMRHLIHQARHEKGGIKTTRRTNEEALIRRVFIQSRSRRLKSGNWSRPRTPWCLRLHHRQWKARIQASGIHVTKYGNFGTAPAGKGQAGSLWVAQAYI
jgi:hypothetical protein